LPSDFEDGCPQNISSTLTVQVDHLEVAHPFLSIQHISGWIRSQGLRIPYTDQLNLYRAKLNLAHSKQESGAVAGLNPKAGRQAS
jgi:hypothetical protein